MKATKLSVKLSVLAVGLAFGAAAYADGVTLYGNIDVGVMSASKACKSASGTTCTATGSVIGLQGSQMQANDFGLKGSENLGNGLTAGFDLEGGFNITNGQIGVDNGTGTTLYGTAAGATALGSYAGSIFSRTAEVNLSGNWGTVAAGNQVDPALIASAGTEPRGLTYTLSLLDAWVLTSAESGGIGSATGALATGSVFDNNSVSYTYSDNGLYVGVLYGFGGVAGSTSAGQQTSLGASYTTNGFTVSGSYAKQKQLALNAGSAVDGSQIGDIGAGYAFGPWAVRAQYGEFKDYGATGNVADDFKVWGLGVDYSTSSANKLNLSFYDGKNTGGGVSTNNKTQEIALMDNYSLSKRTSVYGQIASLKLDQNAGLIGAAMGGLFTPVGAVGVSSVNGSASERTTYVGVGVTHSF